MCGIAGMAGAADRALTHEMLKQISHRGPDDSGTWFEDDPDPWSQVALGNRRLSIIDLSPAGHQPMSNEDDSIWVVYNGEIFNFQELRDELIRDGHTFRSHTDTEVLVHLYEKHGSGLVSRLNGMFAFALWDRTRRELLLARDRMGIKPLYYTEKSGRLYFGSEIKCLLASPDVEPRLDLGNLPLFLSLLYVPNPGTLFEGIYKLPPGSSLTWSKGEIRIDRYWELRYGPPIKRDETELAEELHKMLCEVTKSQLISDVPVGFFLSGGVDSSTLVACAAEIGHSDLKCFSVAFPPEAGQLEQNCDDSRFARLVADHFGADFREIVVDPDVVNLLPLAIQHLEDPVADHAAIATYLICKAAHPEVTVLLSGQGGDEVFGGYRAHLMPRLAQMVATMPKFLRRWYLSQVLPLLFKSRHMVPGAAPGLVQAFCRFSERMIKLAEMEPTRRYANARSYYSREMLDELVNGAAGINAGAFEEIYASCLSEVSYADSLDQLLFADCKTFLPDLNLAYSDKMSMAASVEVRVPLLDNRIVDFMSRVPAGMKIKGFKQKYLLKEAMRGVLPDSVLRRRKAGFGLPVRKWIRDDLREMVHDQLSPARVRQRGLFDPDVVQGMLRENASEARDYTLQIWTLLTLELWQQTFLDPVGPQVSKADHHWARP